jgi:transposase
MLTLPPSTKIYLCSQPVDMRKSFDALSGLIQTHFGQNPLCGNLFVFFSKSRDRMKVLFWDVDGFVLYYKRLETGSFSWVSGIGEDGNAEILASEFALILAGINPVNGRRSKRYHRLPETSLA